MPLKCPEHGSVKRDKARHCPICGRSLVSIISLKTLMPLLKHKYTPAIIVTMVGTLVISSLFFFVLVPIRRDKLEKRAERAKEQEQKRMETIDSMPSVWKVKYSEYERVEPKYDRLTYFNDEMKNVADEYPHMLSFQIDVFLDLFYVRHKDDAYRILKRVMKEPDPR